ncbi:hypothetical protein CsSME_00047763 [Camellia sinensis var. sinensis]
MHIRRKTALDTDWEGVRNLVSALPPSLKRIVLVSSVGVTKFNELPWSIMNLFGVLKYKKMGEDFKIFIHLQTLFLGPELLTPWSRVKGLVEWEKR